MRAFLILPQLYERFFGYDIFISYSRTHSTLYAVSLQKQLQAAGLVCFLDERDIYAGAPLDSTITAAVRRSAALVPVIAKGTESSDFVLSEISQAVQFGKQVIPISLGNEIRANAWYSLQKYRWIDDEGVALQNGIPKTGIATEIKQNFTALRRAQFRRILLGAVGLLFIAIGGLAYAGYHDSRLQRSFGLYARGLEAIARNDLHVAMLFFAKALTKNDSADIRRALTSVIPGPRWRWDFQVQPAADDKKTNDDRLAAPRIAFTSKGDALLVIHGHRLFALDASNGELRNLLRLDHEVTAVAVDDHSGAIAVADVTGRVLIFGDDKFANPRSLFVDGPVHTAAFSKGGSLLGVGVRNGGLRVVDVPSGEEWYRSPSGQHEQTVDAIAFDPRSTRIIWSMGRSLYATEPISDYLRRIGPQNDVINAVAWDARTNIIAAAGIDGPIQLINPFGAPSSRGPSAFLSTQRRAKPDLQELPGHQSGVTSMRYIELDGLLASAGFDGRLRLWSADSGALLFSVAADSASISDLAVSAERGLIATAGHDLRVRVWDIGSDFGKIVWSVKALSDTSFAVRSGGNNIDAIQAIDSDSIIVGHTSGSITAVAPGSTRPIVSLQQVRPRHSFLKLAPAGDAILAVSPALESPRLKALAPGTIQILRKTNADWTVSNIGVESSPIDAAWTHRPDEIAIATDNGSILYGSIQGDTFAQTRAISINGSDRPLSLAVATKSDVVALSFVGGLIATIAQDQRKEHRIGAPIRQISLSPDGKYLAIVTAGPQAKTIVRDVAGAKTVIEVQDWIGDAAFDPQSQFLLLGSDPKGQLVLYDLVQAKEVARWEAHGGGVRAATFSPDGNRLYSAGNDDFVRAWPIEPLRDIVAASAAAIYEQAERSTGLVLGDDDKMALRAVSDQKSDVSASSIVLSVDNSNAFRQVNAVLRTRGGDQEPLAASCAATAGAQSSQDGPSHITNLAIVALCADIGGRSGEVQRAFQHFYDAAAALPQSARPLHVWPGLDLGVSAYLRWAVKTSMLTDIAKGLGLTNIEYLASWRSGSLVRLPPAELLDRYNKALEADSSQTNLNAIDDRARELIEGLGERWVARAATGGEAELVPRLLFSLGSAHLAAADMIGAWTYLTRAAEMAGEIVRKRTQSGDPTETESRRLWTQTLAGAASLGCHVVSKAQDEKKDAVNGVPVKTILSRARETTRSAGEQWRILGEGNATDQETGQSIATLKQTLSWCGTLMQTLR